MTCPNSLTDKDEGEDERYLCLDIQTVLSKEGGCLVTVTGASLDRGTAGPTYMSAGAARLTSEKISLRFTADKTIIFPWRAHMLAAPGVELTEIDVRLGSSYYCIDISSFYTGQTGHDRS